MDVFFLALNIATYFVGHVIYTNAISDFCKTAHYTSPSLYRMNGAWVIVPNFALVSRVSSRILQLCQKRNLLIVVLPE